MNTLYINIPVKYMNIGLKSLPNCMGIIGVIVTLAIHAALSKTEFLSSNVIILKKSGTWPKTVLKRILSQPCSQAHRLASCPNKQDSDTHGCSTALTMRLSLLS